MKYIIKYLRAYGLKDMLILFIDYSMGRLTFKELKELIIYI